MGPIKAFIMGEAAGGDAAFFLGRFEVFFVGEMAGATFIFVGDYRITLVVIWHICFFAVEVAGCVVVTAVGAGSAAGGVGGPEVGVYVGGALGGLTAK